MGDKGFIAPRHIRAIEEIGDRVAMTCDIEKDWKEVIKTEEWEKIDAVALCTPNYLHYPMAEAMKDKVVLSEKPLCLSSKEVEKLKDTNVVLQLRHHPEVIKWKSLIENNSYDDCKLTVKMFRDEQYWNSWKGDNTKSGGILFNLGIHYFDLLIHLFGEKYEIKERIYTDKRCYGVIMFGNTKVSYEIEIIPTREGQVRKLEIDGQEVVLSTQDNLSYEGLHTQIYKDVRKGKGIKPEEAIKSIKLVEELCENNAKNA
jgi:UDP-N-acetyl-2-amino-2-deoxyglucuronate dehydrogenase